MINDEIFKRNKRIIGEAKLALQRDYRRLKIRTNNEPVKENLITKNGIEEALTFGEPNNKALLFATSIPTLVNIVPAIIGTVGVSLSLVILVLNTGYKDIPQDMEIIKQIEDFANNVSSFSADKFNKAIKFLQLPIGITLVSLPNKIIGEKKLKDSFEKRKERYERNINNAISKDETITLIEDIEQNRDDVSLTFIKDFLKNVDLRANNQEYNLALLSKMAEYRAACLKCMRKEASHDDVTASFAEVINTLKTASACNGASVFFKKNPYVVSLLETYTDKKEKKESGFKREESTSLVKKFC